MISSLLISLFLVSGSGADRVRECREVRSQEVLRGADERQAQENYIRCLNG